MAGPTIQEDVVLEADGRQVLSMVDLIGQKLGKIQTEVAEIVKAANRGGQDFDKSLDLTVKRLQQAMGQMRTIAQGNNMPGGAIQDYNANKGLAKATRDATDYARGLGVASGATEALTAKINKLNQAVAERGKNNQFATVGQTNQLKQLEAASAALRKLDSQYDQLEAKARRTRGVDLSPQISAVTDARQRLNAAAMDGRRTNLTTEINGVSDAQAALAERITLARREEATAIRAALAARRELAVADAQGLKTELELGTARKTNADRIRDMREQLKTATGEERNILLQNLEIEKAVGAQLRANTREIENQTRAAATSASLAARQARAMAPTDMQVSSIVRGSEKTLEIEQRAKILAQSQLSVASTDQERAAGLRALEVAEARVKAAQRIVDAENAEVAALNKAAAAAEKLRLENQKIDRNTDKVTAGSFATQQISTLGLEGARAAAKARVEAAEAAIVGTTGKEKQQLTEILQLEQRRLAAVESQGRAAQAQQRSSLLGRAKTAITNTALYGGVAALGFGALNEIQQGVQFTIEFEDELAKLQAIANATNYQMVQLKSSIVAVGESSRFSLLDLTKIAQTLAQTGVSAGDMEKVLRSVTTLATASGSTPDEAVQLVTSALGSFQLQASESARVADLLTTALNRTKLTVQQAGQAIQYVGATAFENNISLEQLLATVGAMAQAGLKSGSTIGTGLRQLFVDLQTPSKKLTDQLKALGLSAADVNVAVRGEGAVLDTLAKAGFGAAQAYEGLETRAAAAYIVLKNNRDVIDQLQVSFAQQGAAAAANERAMNSLSAQWQRFKNIVSAGFSDDFDVVLNVLKDVLKQISDHNDESKRLADEMAQRQAGGLAGYQQRDGNFMGILSYENENLIPDTIKSVAKLQEVTLNLLDGSWWTGASKGWGTRWAEYSASVAGAGNSVKDLTTRMNEASEKVDAQSGVVSELDKELGRLITQHSNLSGNNLRTTAETVTLTSKFDGLAKYLTNTKDRYGDLINAMVLYRNEASRTLAADLSGQISVQRQQENAALDRARGYANQALANKPLMASLTAQERGALARPRAGNNALVIGDAARRTNDPTLLSLSQALGENAQAITQGRIATETLNDTLTRSQTPAGQSLQLRTTRAESGLTELGGLSGKARTDAAAATTKLAQEIIAETTRRLARGPANDPAAATLRDWQVRAQAVVTGIKAALAPTAAEVREVNKVEPRPKVTREDVIAGVRDILGQGQRLGSGERTAAHQDELVRRGLTRVPGSRDDHVPANGGLAQDFPIAYLPPDQGRALAQRIKKHLADQGIEANVVYETGRGRNQGSTSQIHVGIRKNVRRGAGSNSEARNDVSNDKLAVDNLSDTLDNRLKDLGRSTTDTVFEANDKAARDALAAWAAKMREVAEGEIVAKGYTANQAADRRRELERTIAAKTDEVNQKIMDGLIKNVEAQFKAAQDAFDLSLKPMEDRVSAAQARVNGLGYFSNTGKIPDYVSQLASQRVAQATEARDRARAAALPTLIDGDQGKLDALTAKVGAGNFSGVQLDQANEEIKKLTASIAALRTEKQNLDTALGAGGLVPTTIADGLQQAITAYEQAHNMSNTFKQDVIQNLGGAIDQVSTSLTDMFTSIVTGSQSAIAAFGTFAMSIIRYIQQMVAKIIATKVLELLFKIGASFIGGAKTPDTSTTVPGNPAGSSSFFDFGSLGSFNGGPAMPEGLLGGGRVANGSDTHDSVTKRLAKGEWVINRKAVDSVGNGFMASLNQHGSKALSAMQQVPALPAPQKQETNVWVVKPDQQPPLGKNDVLVAVHEDILSGGETRKLIKYVAQD